MALLTTLAVPVRLALVLLCIVVGLTTQLLFFWWISPSSARRIVQVWSRCMLLCLGVRLHTAPLSADYFTTPKAALVVSNHISWLDILALQATMPVVFVAKSEIKSWPVLGWMVSLAGTCFIDRTRRTALRSVHTALTNHLLAGQSVCIFPEGTTTDGQQVLPFHAGLLQAAIEAKVPVQPVCLQYSHIAAAYVDELTLLGSLGNVLLTPQLAVRVNALPALSVEGATRQSLGLMAHDAIEQAAKNTPLLSRQ